MIGTHYPMQMFVSPYHTVILTPLSSLVDVPAEYQTNQRAYIPPCSYGFFITLSTRLCPAPRKSMLSCIYVYNYARLILPTLFKDLQYFCQFRNLVTITKPFSFQDMKNKMQFLNSRPLAFEILQFFSQCGLLLVLY